MTITKPVRIARYQEERYNRLKNRDEWDNFAEFVRAAVIYFLRHQEELTGMRSYGDTTTDGMDQEGTP